jgi:dihydroorotate dehydrogenase
MNLFDLVRPPLFLLSPERAHDLTLAALKLVPVGSSAKIPDPVLVSQVAGLTFRNPVGLAAGFDKNATVPQQALQLGFGFVEVGTLTPLPQKGNPKPRLFRLGKDRAVINRMGFNNGGLIDAYPRLRHARMKRPGVIGVNVGANKDSLDRIADYAVGVARMAALASYITINISSPNTPGLRALQDEGALSELIDAVRAAVPENGPPLFLKLAPDLELSDIDVIVRLAMGKMAALIVSNTTVSRPSLRSKYAQESGGLSGAPLKALAQQRLVDFRRASGGAIPLIGVGGIASAEDAYARIRAGASLVQVYSALVYEGPGLARRINKGLVMLLKRDGFANVADAVGVDAS